MHRQLPPRAPIEQPATEPDSLAMRQAMGRFATGVTVVTTRLAECTHGMTANGFLSVSLDPALVLISLGRCRMRTLLDGADSFAINVLSEDQEDLSAHFAGQPRFASVDFDEAHGYAFLPGAIAHIGARIVDRHEAGDHMLFIGRVDRLRFRDGRPLLFYTGGYRQVHVGLTDEVFSF
jgi:flavin reductase (DIM6/NTAB) family NADH-FMN oxidoreductase RutF